MELTNEKSYPSPQRKLVNFFEHSRDRWKAKSRAAKTGLKRRGTRRGRLERSNAAYQDQLAVLHTQVAEGQAEHEQTRRGLEELKKSIRGFVPIANERGVRGRGRAASSLRRAARTGGRVSGVISGHEFARGRAGVRRKAGLRGFGAVESVVVEHAVRVVAVGILQADADQRGRQRLGLDCGSCGADGAGEVPLACGDQAECGAGGGGVSHAR